MQALSIITLPFYRFSVLLASEDRSKLLLTVGLPFRAPAEPDLAGFGDQHAAVLSFLRLFASEGRSKLVLMVGLPFCAPVESDLAGIGDQHSVILVFLC